MQRSYGPIILYVSPRTHALCAHAGEDFLSAFASFHRNRRIIRRVAPISWTILISGQPMANNDRMVDRVS